MPEAGNLKLLLLSPRRMDNGTLLVNIALSIRMMIPMEENVKYQTDNCKSLVSHLRLLKQLFDDLRQSKVPMSETTVAAFESLQSSLLKAKDILGRCAKGSKIYSVLRSHQVLAQFQSINVEIESALCASCLISHGVSKQSQNLAEKCIQDLRRANYTVDGFDEQIMQEIENLLVEHRDGRKASFEKLQKLAVYMDIKTKEDVSNELSALEKARNVARMEKDKMEEDFIDQVISLFMQLAEDDFDDGHAKTEIQGVLIPADFRCPLSLELMSDPVIVASGQTYERAYIQHWLDQGNKRCPKTGQLLDHTNLIPNYTVKALIANWCQTNGVPLPKLDTVKSINWPPPTCPPEPEGQGSQETVQVPESLPSAHSRLNTLDEHHESFSVADDKSQISPHGNTFRGSDDVHEIQLSSGVPVAAMSAIVRRPSSNYSGELSGELEALRMSWRDSPDNFPTGPRKNQKAQKDRKAYKSIYIESDRSADPVAAMPVSGARPSCNYSGELSGELEALGLSLRNSPDHFPTAPKQNQKAQKDIYLGSDRSAEALIERLVLDLQSTDADVQRSSAAELRLLAKVRKEDRIRIANAGAIKYLVALLSSPDLKAQENSVTALLNLSLNDNNKAEIADAGAIEPLIHVLRVGTIDARQNAAATLYSLSVKEDYKEIIGACGAIPLLVDLLRNGLPRGKKDAATALFNLSLFPDNKLRIVEAGAIRPLIDLVCEPRMGMVDKAVSVLATLSTINEGKVAIGEQGGIPPLVEVVEAGSPKAKESAAAALLQLCANSQKYRNMTLQEGAIPPLHLLSQMGTPRAKEKAVGILRLFREQRHASLGRHPGRSRHM